VFETALNMAFMLVIFSNDAYYDASNF
jgi:hypothetical protein